MKTFNGFYFGKEKFASDTSDTDHTRSVGHKVKVYSFKGLSWSQRGKLWEPVGSLDLEFEEDLGARVLGICSETPIKEYLEDVVLNMPDGTLIEGKRYKISKYIGKPNAQDLSNQFLNMQVDTATFKSNNYFSYTVSVRKECMGAESPHEFQILTYVDIDGKRVQETPLVLRSRYSGTLPNRLAFKGFVTSRK
jgi:hypothetical protein